MHETIPPSRPEFFHRRQSNAADERIEPGPGWVVDPGLKAAEGDTRFGQILPGKNRPQRNSAQDDEARNDDGGGPPAIQKKKNEWQEQIELVFDRERPGVRECGAAMEADVLHGNEKFPGRRHFRILAPRWQEDINAEDDEVGRQDAQGASREETPKGDALIGRERGEQLAADQVSAKDEEKIDTDPAESVHAAWKRKAHDAGVINDHDDDGQRAQKIETRLAFTIGKAWVNGCFGCGLVNGGKRSRRFLIVESV